MNRWYLFALVPFLGAGCTAMDVIVPDDDVDEEAAVVLPVEGYVAQRTFIGDDRGSDIFHLEFSIPENMEVEYIPSIQSLNIFTLDGEGTARERSQFLVRYFDASTFLTLSTVTVHSTEALAVGGGDYDARRYDIEKKPGVADFVDQPSWRNTRHIVTDFTAGDGYGRYYVIAANPDVDPALYDTLLKSMRVTE